jgi:protein-S-isoprenylcysteine O-methyltransferase Ste14
MSPVDHLLYAALWLGFGAGHSLLAGATLKRAFGAGYRLAYNVIALGHLAAIMLVGRIWLDPGGAAFDRPFWLQALQGGLVIVGIAGLALALRSYDSGLLAGTAQWRAARRGETVGDDDESLRLDGLHRYVRHPLYAAAFPVLWGLVDSEFALATALWASAYFWIGSRYEERRLIARYGDAYRAYRVRVPAFIPWKGRVA